MEQPRKFSRLKRGCAIATIVVAGIVIYFWPLLVGAADLYRKGVLQGTRKHEYEGSSIDNLKAMRTALLGYEESEGQFPMGSGWMDAIQNRLNTDDLKKGEAAKKLVLPELLDQPGKYGYGFNQELEGHYRGEVKDPKTPLVFESTETGRNAAGDAKELRRPGGLAIAVDGTILR